MLDPTVLHGKMRSLAHAVKVNIFLTMLIFILAQAGHVVGLHNLVLAISVFWPAAGFSLAAILLFGNRTLPAIFLGNFFYNFFYLSQNSDFMPAFSTAIAITLGSTMQAWLGGKIITTLSSPRQFLKTARDVFIFLIPAGVLTCMVASTIGVAALYLNEVLTLPMVLNVWRTFWLGDSIGVYVITPFLMVWLTQKSEVRLKDYSFEALAMLVYFLLLAVMTIFGNQFLGYLFMPICLWATYRFRMHGAALSILLVTLVIVFPTALGYGAFVSNVMYNPLLILVSFLEIIVATCLILAAIINERQEAWRMVQEYNIDLQSQVKGEVFVKEKLASLSMLTAGIGREIQIPLNEIATYSNASQDCLSVLDQLIISQENLLDPNTGEAIRNNLESLNNCLNKISQQGERANHIVEIMRRQVERRPGRYEVKSINLHALLQNCLNQALIDWDSRHPGNKFNIEKTFLKSSAMIPGIAEDLSHAFINIFDNAFYSMAEKEERLESNYEPILMIRIIESIDTVKIIITDNGEGIPKYRLDSFFQPFSSTKPSGEATGLGLPMAHDIIVQEHHGNIKVDSIEGEFLELTIILPKFRMT